MQKIKRLLILQWYITLIMTGIFLVFSGKKAAWSVVLGGLVCMIPLACFAGLFFKHKGAISAKKIVQGFYKGEALKIILSVGLFATVFMVYPVVPSAFFLTYILLQLTHWLTPWIVDNTHQ